jgi:hypothetical protein
MSSVRRPKHNNTYTCRLIKSPNKAQGTATYTIASVGIRDQGRTGSSLLLSSRNNNTVTPPYQHNNNNHRKTKRRKLPSEYEVESHNHAKSSNILKRYGRPLIEFGILPRPCEEIDGGRSTRFITKIASLSVSIP